MTDRLGRLLLVTLEAARVNADLPALGVSFAKIQSGGKWLICRL